ncbi:MAG TPA: AMP-binding protein [Lacipirellulaceae bacterium]|nr:AMP-binding protein [Lacipirellulaceae bacterium]
MTATSIEERRRIIQLDRAELAALQLEKLNRLLAEVSTNNAFYRHKLVGSPSHFASVEQLFELPFTTKDELQPAADDEPFATNRNFPIERYVRCHQTSGTRGRPLVVLDTADDWRWWIEVWQYVLDAAGVTPNDRALLAFSFGPFIGFWSAFDALVARGTLVIPGGGLGSVARLELIRGAKATTLLCTPTYALRLVEVATEHKINLAHSTVEKIVVAGEPGGSIPVTRQRIESAWGARLIDHGGATEVGAWGFSDPAGRGLHVNEAHFIAEFISVATGQPSREGELSHLVLTSLGRYGSPILRYRTGDLVRPTWPTDGTNRFVFLEGGILGRADDMMIIRGMNVYPSAIEQILHSFPEVVEYRLTARKHGEMDELAIEVEDHLERPARIVEELQLRLGLKIDVRCVPTLSLPRFEGKGRRFIDERVPKQKTPR